MYVCLSYLEQNNARKNFQRMSDLVRTVIRNLPTEAAILLSRTDQSIVCMSGEAERICEKLSQDWVLAVVKECPLDNEGVIKTFRSDVGSGCGRREFLGRNEETFQFKNRVIPNVDSVSLFLIQTLPSYDELLEKCEAAEYAANTLNKGLCLIRSRVDDKSCSMECMFITEKLADLSGTSMTAIKSSGLGAICQCVIAEDRIAFTQALEKLYLPEWSVAVRLEMNGKSHWRRFMGKSIEMSSSKKEFETSVLCEDYSEGAKEAALKEMIDSPSGQAASNVLSSLISTMFDASLYVDDEFRIVTADEKSRVRSFFIGNKEALSVKGLPLDCFIPNEEERHHFNEFFVKPLVTGSNLITTDRSTSPLAAALMIRTHMILSDRTGEGEEQASEVKVYGCPTFLHILPIFNEDTVQRHLPTVDEFPSIVVGAAARRDQSRYLIGIRLASKEGAEPSIPVAEVSQRLARSRSEIGQPYSPPLAAVPEDELPTEEFESFPLPKYLSLSRPVQESVALSLQRLLNRDILHSLACLDSEPAIADWLVVRYTIADISTMEEELVRSLSSKHQAHFHIGSKSNNYSLCASALESSIQGNANILNPSNSAGVSSLCDNLDLVHCAFRFFLGMAGRIPDQAIATRLLIELENSIPRLVALLGKIGHAQTLFEFTLTLLTAALRFPSMCQTTSSMQWIRKYFTDAMKLRETKTVNKSRKLPAMYFLCVLWASLMHIVGRNDESSALLKNLSDDMRTYCLRHPESATVRKLQAICLHNLAVSAIAQRNLVAAFGWIHELQDILSGTHVTYPTRCSDLVIWAQTSQTEAQAHFRRVRE